MTKKTTSEICTQSIIDIYERKLNVEQCRSCNEHKTTVKNDCFRSVNETNCSGVLVGSKSTTLSGAVTIMGSVFSSIFNFNEDYLCGL